MYVCMYRGFLYFNLLNLAAQLGDCSYQHLWHNLNQHVNELASPLLLFRNDCSTKILAQRTLTSSTIVSTIVPASHLVTSLPGFLWPRLGQSASRTFWRAANLASPRVSLYLVLFLPVFLHLCLSLSLTVSPGVRLSVTPDSACLCVFLHICLSQPLHLTHQLCIANTQVSGQGCVCKDAHPSTVYNSQTVNTKYP